MTSTERTAALVVLGRAVASELNKLNPFRPWTFVEPTEDTYSVYLRNAGKARIYFGFDRYENPKRLTISGYLHIGKNGQYVEVYDKGVDRTGWNRVTAPNITVALSRGCEAIAKDIAKRFLPEYLYVLALAEDKVAKDAAYEAKIAENLQHLASIAGVAVPSHSWSSEVCKSVSFRTGEQQYHSLTVSDHDADLKLDSLTFEQAGFIIRYLQSKK